MSTAVGSRPLDLADLPAPAAAPRRGAPAAPLVLACLAVAALAHALPAAPTYDPWAWISWGREIVHLDLDTRTGPSWKPLPVLFTTPFALAGDRWAPIVRDLPPVLSVEVQTLP